MDIYIEEASSAILVREKWMYTWIDNGFPTWTYKEKKDFHDKADNIIWQNWGGKLKVGVNGSSTFAQRNKTKHFTIKFDIEWVLTNEHWKVRVTKIARGTEKTSSIQWPYRTINLDSEDVYMRRTFHQIPVAHEFGHTVGNSTYAATGMHGDEYKPTSPYYSDTNSMMHIGLELRKRHIDFLILELNQMMPNTTFYAI